MWIGCGGTNNATSISMPNVKTDQSAAASSADKFAAWQRRRAQQLWRAKLPQFIGSAVLTVMALIYLQLLPFAEIFERIERANLDLYFRLRSAIKPDPRIHLVVIDDESLQKAGGWPWPHAKLAELVTRILAANPKLVVCDFVLPAKTAEATGTKALANVAASSRKVIFPFYFSNFGQTSDHPVLPEPIAASAYLLFDFREKLLTDPPVVAGTVNYPAEELVAASLPSGHINLFPEENLGESTVRWEAQIVRHGDSYFPSLPVQAVAQFLQSTRGQVQVKVGAGIQVGEMFAPTDRRGWTLINYYGGAGIFSQTSAAAILQQGAAAELQNKIVFIGVTAAGTQDIVPTPMSPRLPGVEKLATSTANILQGNALIRNNTIENFELIMFLALGFAGLSAALRLPRLYVGVALLALILLAWVGAFGFFTLGRVWLKSVTMIVAIAVTGGVAAFLRRQFPLAPQFVTSPDATVTMGQADAKGEPVRFGRFEIIGEIGSGAMGKIYEGFDPTINRRVAIKTIRTDLIVGSSERMRQRFLREAQAAGALNHPNIVTIYQADEAGAYSYIAMEFLEGETLEQIIRKRAPLALEEICRLVTPICEALDYAHRNGVVHRDIKPANIMVTNAGIVKVMDFGIAHVDYSTLTQDGAVLGTPSYMSPEQIRGDKVDGQSDLFSLGVIVYEMATGQRPFLGDTLAAISNRILSQKPLRVSELNPKLSPALDAALAQAMAKDKTKRFAVAKEFAEALNAVRLLKEP
jgi:CHASE2 domain-containing sensor protein